MFLILQTYCHKLTFYTHTTHTNTVLFVCSVTGTQPSVNSGRGIENMLDNCWPWAAALPVCLSCSSVLVAVPHISKMSSKEGKAPQFWEREPHQTNGKEGWSGAVDLLCACQYFVLCSMSVCSSPPCFPSLSLGVQPTFRTPGIANGVLLVCLMWAKQSGNKSVETCR